MERATETRRQKKGEKGRMQKQHGGGAMPTKVTGSKKRGDSILVFPPQVCIRDLGYTKSY